jgi:hypothetical protein
MPAGTTVTALVTATLVCADSQLLLHLKREYSWVGMWPVVKRCCVRASAGMKATQASRTQTRSRRRKAMD